MLGRHLPLQAPKPCAEPGCGKLTDRARCADHRREHDLRRGTSRSRGYGKRWERIRLEHLAIEPHCRECSRFGDRRPGSHVDHIVPHRGDPALFNDRANLQTLCASHHTQKTGIEASMSDDELRARYAPDALTGAAIQRRQLAVRGGWLGA